MFRDRILRIFLRFFGGKDQILSFYGFEHLPAVFEPFLLLKICAFSMFISVLSGLIPTFRALHLDPSKALRHE
jgi:ABC-type lipoprotein release transport system permease subunit